jgi:hypothetical protein
MPADQCAPDLVPMDSAKAPMLSHTARRRDRSSFCDAGRAARRDCDGRGVPPLSSSTRSVQLLPNCRSRLSIRLRAASASWTLSVPIDRNSFASRSRSRCPVIASHRHRLGIAKTWSRFEPSHRAGFGWRSLARSSRLVYLSTLLKTFQGLPGGCEPRLQKALS